MKILHSFNNIIFFSYMINLVSWKKINQSEIYEKYLIKEVGESEKPFINHDDKQKRMSS